jgi:hypothetical protein
MSVVAVPTAMGSGINATMDSAMGTTVPAAPMTTTTMTAAAAAGCRGHGIG